MTFTFSEAPVASFTESDIQVSAGLTLVAGSLTMVDATHYTATVTADDGFTGTGTVSLAAGSYTDAALNPGGAGSDTVAIDTAESDRHGRHRRRLAEQRRQQLGCDLHVQRGAGSGFTEADIQVSAGLTLVAGSLTMVDATHYTATVIADDGFIGTGTVSVAAGSYTDAALNLGDAGSDTVSIDTVNPTVTVDIVDASLNDSDNSSVVTFTFTEAPTASRSRHLTFRRATLCGSLVRTTGNADLRRRRSRRPTASSAPAR